MTATPQEAAAAPDAVKGRPVSVGQYIAAEPMPSGAAALAEGLRALYSNSELCDVALVACGERFPAHKAMLAAISDTFRNFLRELPQRVAGDGTKEDPLKGLLVPIIPEAPEPADGPASAPAVAAPAVAAKVEGAPDAAAGAATPAGAAPPAAAPAAGAAAPAAAAAPAPAAAAAAAESAPGVAAPGSAGAAPPAAPAEPAKPEAPRKPSLMEFEVTGVQTAEAVRIVLSYTYGVGTGAPWEYTASSAEVNKDVLRLSSHLGLTHMHEHAARWLTTGLTTGNVVQRMVTCEEFGLGALRQKIIEQLASNPAELAIVSSSMDIMKHPRILQDLLMFVAHRSSIPAAPTPEPEKPAAEKSPPAQPAAKAEKAEKEKAKEEPAEKPHHKAASKAQEKAAERPLKRAKRGASSA